MKKVQFLEETELGTATYGATRMADLTEQEFRQRHLGLNMSKVREMFVYEIRELDSYCLGICS